MTIRNKDLFRTNLPESPVLFRRQCLRGAVGVAAANIGGPDHIQKGLLSSSQVQSNQCISSPRSRDPGYIIPDLLSRISDPGSLIPDLWSRISDPGSLIPDLWSRISDPGSLIPDPRSRIPYPTHRVLGKILKFFVNWLKSAYVRTPLLKIW